MPCRLARTSALACLLALFCLSQTAAAGEKLPIGVSVVGDGTWKVDFPEGLPVSLKGFVLSGWQPTRFGGDTARLEPNVSRAPVPASDAAEGTAETEAVPHEQAEAYALLDARRLVGQAELAGFQLLTLSHSYPGKTLVKHCLVSVSADGVAYTDAELTASPAEKLDAGWSRQWLRAEQPLPAFRYLKIQISPDVDAKSIWKIKFAELHLCQTFPSEFPEASALPEQSAPQPEPTAGKDDAAVAVPVAGLPEGGVRAQIEIPTVLLAELPGLKPSIDDVDPDALPWKSVELYWNPQKSRAWNAHGVSADTRGVLYKFAVETASAPTGRIVLILKQCAFLTTVFIDGKALHTFREGFLPLELDITDAVSAPGVHTVHLEVKDHFSVRNNRDQPAVPIGAMYRYTKGLLYPPVLQSRPAVSLRSPCVRSSEDLRQLTATVDVAASAGTPSPDMSKQQVEAAILDESGAEILRATSPLQAADAPLTVSTEPSAASPLFRASFSFDVKDKLRVWDIGQPALYSLRLRLTSGGTTADELATTFGHRSVAIRGEDLFLNGRKTRLLGPWAHIGEWSYAKGPSGALSVEDVCRTLLRLGMNYGRLHAQVYPDEFYEAADRVGLLIVAESSLNHTPVDESSLEHVRAMATRLRNHPSIVIWSGSNEFEHWLVPRPAPTEAFLVRVQEEYHRLDPTRPVLHSGFGDAQGKIDIYNIHYPEGVNAESPRSFYWKAGAERIANRLYPDNYRSFPPMGKKPLAIGEQLIPASSYPMEMMHGEAALNFRLEPTPESLAENSRLLAGFWREAIRSYREQNIAMVSPNVFYMADGLDSVFLNGIAPEGAETGAYIAELAPELRGGKNPRTLRMFENVGRAFTGKAVVTLRMGDLTQTTEHAATLAAGEIKDMPITFTLPQAATDAAGTLTATMFDAAGKEVYACTRDVKFYATETASPAGATLAVLGLTPELADVIKAAGFTPVATEPDAIGKLDANAGLLIASEVPAKELEKASGSLAAFVEKGGRALLMARRDAMPEIFPVRLKLKSGTYPGLTCAFIRAPHHPLFQNGAITDTDLRFWGDDLRVAENALYKPSSGPVRCLIDGAQELSAAALLEIRHGDGRYVVCQLRLPAAGAAPLRILSRLLHDLQRSDTRESPQAVLAGNTEAFTAATLGKMGWITAAASDSTSSSTRERVVLIDADALAATGAEKTAAFASSASVIYLHRLAPVAARELLAALHVPEPVWNASPATNGKKAKAKKKTPVASAIVAQRAPLLDGISSADLKLFSDGLPQTETMEEGNGWTVPVRPGVWGIYRHNGKTVILDLLPWNQEVDFPENRDRFLSALWQNLGIGVPGQKIAAGGDASFLPVNLQDACTASAQIMIGPDFPSGEQTLSGVPFRFLLGSAAKPNTLIRLSGLAHAEGSEEAVYDTPIDRFENPTPKSVTIPLGRVQAQTIYFAHAATRNWKMKSEQGLVCTYRIVYEDETSESVPLMLGRDILDSRNNPAETGSCSIGLTCPNPKNGMGETFTVGVFAWSNPYPERKIRQIEIISGGNPQSDPMVFAITIREAKETFF